MPSPMSPKYGLLALVAVALLASAAAAGSLSEGGLAAVAASDPKAEAQSLVNSIRNSVETLASRAELASIEIGKLSVSGAVRGRDSLEAEVEAIGEDLDSLDVKLRALDIKLGLLAANGKSGKSSRELDDDDESAANQTDGFKVTCEVTDRTVGKGGTVTYSAAISGGTKPFKYRWSGSFSGVNSTQKATFVERGTFKEKVLVADRNGKTAEDDCPKVEVDRVFGDGLDDDTAARASNATVSVLAPVGGARIKVATSTSISWRAVGLASSDRLDIYLDGGTDGKTYYIASTLDKGSQGRGTFLWPSAGTVASDFVPYGGYTLRVCTTDDEVCGAAKILLVKP